jgi:hypothetical protein
MPLQYRVRIDGVEFAKPDAVSSLKLKIGDEIQPLQRIGSDSFEAHVFVRLYAILDVCFSILSEHCDKKAHVSFTFARITVEPMG